MRKQVQIQGDVILHHLTNLPDKVEKTTPEPLALGEVTGHKHVVKGDVSFYRDAEENLYLSVGSEGATLYHGTEEQIDLQASGAPFDHVKEDTHEKQEIAEGEYGVEIQVQYTPEGWEKSAD